METDLFLISFVRLDTNLIVKSYMEGFLTTVMLYLLFKKYQVGKQKKYGTNYTLMSPMTLTWHVLPRGNFQKLYMKLKAFPSIILF